MDWETVPQPQAFGSRVPPRRPPRTAVGTMEPPPPNPLWRVWGVRRTRWQRMLDATIEFIVKAVPRRWRRASS